MRIMTILLLLPAFQAFSEPTFIPPATNPCGLNSCSAPQQMIWEGYSTGITTHVEPNVYSGNCYITGRGYNKEHGHHGVALMDQVEGQPHYGGRFAFFYSENPFLGWDVLKARTELPTSQEPSHLMTVTDSFGFIDLNAGKKPIWQYYFRLSPDGQKLYVLGYWDNSHRVLCSMDKHLPPEESP